MRRSMIPAALAVVAAGCGPVGTASPAHSSGPTVPAATATPAASPSVAPSGSPAAVHLAFQVSQAGGFIAPSAELATLPSVSVFSDGTILRPAPMPAIAPAPALPGVIVDDVTPAGLAALLDAAKATGLGDPTASFDGGPAPDAGVTLITIDLGGLPRTVRISSLGDTSRDGDLDPKVVAARVRLRALLATFDDLATALGSDLASGPRPYQPTALRLIVSAGDPSGGSGATPIAWPLATPLSSFGVEIAVADGLPPAAGLNGGATARCGTASGADLAALLPLARRATVVTPWTSAGQSFGISFRPLLPLEQGCPGA